MKFVLFLYERDTDWDAVPADSLDSAMDEHARFVAYLDEHGVEWSGHAVRPSTDAVTLHTDGRRVDGPFAQLPAHIGGLYVIEAADLEAALDIAKRCPTGVATEVRPIWG